MALSASTVWEIRTAGSDTNGGGYVSGGTDYSQQDAKNTVGNNISTTDAVANGTTTITSASGAFTSALTGNIIYLQGGSGGLAAGWYQATYVSATSFTVDRTVAAGTGITMNIGGALLSIGIIGSVGVSGNVAHIKSGAYSITSASTNIAGGCLSRSSVNLSLVGYTSTRGDMGSTRPVFTASGAISSFTVITVGTANSLIANLEIDCASKTTSRAFNITNGLVYKCKASNCTNGGFINASLADIAYCEATGCATASAAIQAFQLTWGCYAHDNSVVAFNNCSRCEFCIADTNSGASTDGFISNAASSWMHCIAYNNGRDGFRIGASQVHIEGCIAEANTGIGFNGQNTAGMVWSKNAAYNNGTNYSLGTGLGAYNLNSITGTGSFFTNAASGDFSLNNTSGAGATVRAASALGAFPGGLSTGYLDIGAVQHRDASGVGGGGTLRQYNVSPTASGSANVKGSYSELVASTPYASSRLYVTCVNGSTGNQNYLVDIATGAAGAETVVIANIHAFANTEIMMACFAAFDVDIPAGTRISTRCQAATGSQAVNVSICLDSRSIASVLNPVTYGADTSSSRGTQVDPGGTINTKGSYTQITGATTARIDEAVVLITANTAALPAFQTWKVDIAIGGSGSEIVVIPDIYIAANTFGDQPCVQAFRFACNVSPNTRISARCECTGNSAGSRELDIVVIGNQVPGGLTSTARSYA